MDLKDAEHKLKFIGFDSQEAKVYLTLLRIGTSKAGQISKEASINRTTTYDILKRLLDKGLVSYVIKDNRRWFIPTHPSQIVELLREKKNEAKRLLPYLNELYKKPKSKYNIKLYYGLKSMKSVFQDIIREGQPNAVLDGEGQFIKRMPYYAAHFIKQLNKKEIPIRHIARKGCDINTSNNAQVRFIDKKSKSTAAINIYANKVAIIIWTERPEAVIIENKGLADSLKEYFNIIWAKAKK